jgi:uncharacterized hydrophobic protein (TIGR00341 family)
MPPALDRRAVRYVEVSVPAGKRDAVLRVLDDEDIDYVVTAEDSDRDYTAVVSFPLPPNAVEPVLDALRVAGLPEDAFTVVLDAQTVVSRRFERLVERYAEDDIPERIAREELEARAESLTPDVQTFFVMAVASVAIATAGVLLDSAAIVVGSMVIAPFIGPAMATSVGTVVQDKELFWKGTKLQVFGFFLAIVTAAVFALLVKSVHFVPPGLDVVGIGQVRERLAPDFLSLVVALGAGVAGAYSLSSGVSTSLVGVMIAVALVPPTAVIGIGVAWGLPAVVTGATVLLLVNFLSINLAALAVLWYQGYRPDRWYREESARAETLRLATGLLAAILVLSAFLGGVTFFTYQAAVTEQEIHSEVEATLEQPPYADEAVLLDLEVQTTRGILATDPESVVVTVGHPPGATYPTLRDDLAVRLSPYDVTVEVRFVVVDRPAD